MRVTTAHRVGRMLVANGWTGEGSTVMANAERVKGAAEAYRHGSLLGLARRSS
jgi:hypothetical protein